jgi:hypothetical protein
MVHWNLFRTSSLLACLACLFVLPSRILADEQGGFDCHVTASGAEFDLTKLGHEYVLNRTRDMPPTRMVESLTFNLCADITLREDTDERDQVSPWNYLDSTL